jgi:acetylserotonin N-methyltransferase
MSAEADPTPILELIEGFQRSQILIAAVRLGIFDGARPPAAELERLLEACASLGLLQKRGPEYVNTPLADEYLRSAGPRSLSGFIRFAGASLYPRWGELDRAVIEGTARINPLSIRGTLNRAYRRLAGPRTRPDLNRDFNAGMHGLGMISSPAIAEAFDLSGFRNLVDLGGSTGHLALAIGERYPGMRLAVFDLPHVIAVAKEYTGGRVDLCPGDLFTDPLPPADLYALGKVLHNCDERACRLLLRRVYDALPQRGGFLVAERLLDDDRLGPVHVHASALNMLVVSHGRERTFSEYRKLLLQAGFADVRVKKTGAPVDAMLAIK